MSKTVQPFSIRRRRMFSPVALDEGVLRRLRQLHRVLLPERLERLKLMIALGSVLLAADDADGDTALGKDGCSLPWRASLRA